MAVVALTDRVHVLQQFTSDPQVLMTAIKNFRPQEQILQPSGPVPTSELVGMSGPRGGSAGATAALILATQAEIASFADAQIAYDIERRSLITIEAMRSMVRMLGGLGGRKKCGLAYREPAL